MAKRKGIIITLAVITVCAAMILIFAMGKAGTSVSREEFLLIYENEVRPRVLALSQDPGGNWYDQPYEDTTLGQYAQQLTVNALKDYKAQQQLFREKGLWDFSYEDFISQWESQEADGNPYGVQAYSQYDYYVYLHSVYSLQLMQGYAVDGKAAMEYYTQNQDQFLDQDIWELELWQTESENAETLLQQAMQNGEAEQVSYSRVTLDADAAKYYPDILALVQEELQQLKTPGQTVFRENDGTYFLIRSKGFTEGKPIPYEECEDVVRNRCRQQLLEQAVTQALEDIKVEPQALPAAGK